MCSIMGYCDCCAAFSDFEEGFKKTVSRGPDDSRIIDTGKGLLGFHRLAIMGLTPDGMQPFELDGSYVVCNGEIYGYEKIKEELAKKYTFKSGSDCEILLPLYREYGVDMFKMLDAEFALIIYDGEEKKYIAAGPTAPSPSRWGNGQKPPTGRCSKRARTVTCCGMKRSLPITIVGSIPSGCPSITASNACTPSKRSATRPVRASWSAVGT